MVLMVNGLFKSISKVNILKDISFSINENEILGLIGPNGSGKSTIMKCIAGLYHPTSGEITINGYDIDKDRVNALSNMGVSIEYPALYPNLTGKDHFKMVAKWKKLDKSRIKEMEDFSGLNSELKKEVRHYSMGMKQRLILSLAMMTKPKLLILDEPTNGLDPQAIIDLRKKLLDIRNDGTSILLSSHQLSEVDKLVDRIIFIKDGQLIAHKTIDELHQKHILCIKTSDNQYAQKILKDYIVTNDNEYIRLECGSDNDFSNVINLLVKNNISIYLIEDKRDLKNRIKLQDMYMKNQFYDFVYEKMPTAYYMLSNFFVFGGIPIIVILACVILSNFDCWSKDFESNTYKLLFTMTGSRTKIYLSRTIVTSIATMIMSLMMISILFVLGYYAYGLGDEVFVTVKNTFVPISMWCMNNLMITIVLLAFLSTMIQVLSLLTKNSGISLLVPCLCLLVLLTDINLFGSIFSINSLILWIIILLIVIIHFCMVKYLERIDLNGAN